MDKKQADRTITKYIEKIFGFSLSKTKKIDLAEELSSRIVFEVYKALLEVKEIHNLDGYVYRIASNVYARFMVEEMRGITPTVYPNSQKSIDKNEGYIRIREQIVYLSQIQREIIILHYFDKMKLKDIAEKLSLSLGTVKWHLHEAREQMKEGFNNAPQSTYNSNLRKFHFMQNYGSYGPLNIEMPFYFTSTLSQNIALAAYDFPRTMTEIANALRVPAVFVENEMEHLLESNFMVRSPGNKYQTNIYIIKETKEKAAVLQQIVQKYRQIVYDEYLAFFLKEFQHSVPQSIYTPNNDHNFFMWSLVSYACFRKFAMKNEQQEATKFFVNRRYYGKNIALAAVCETGMEYDNKQDRSFDRMGTSHLPEVYPFTIWQFWSKFDDRKDHNSTHQEFENLYDLLNGKIQREVSHIETYQRLFRDGYIISQGATEIANIVMTSLSQAEFDALLPPISENLRAISHQIDEEMFRLHVQYCPSSMHELCRFFSRNSLARGSMRVGVLDLLLEKGKLKPLKKNQKRSVNTIMFQGII